MATRLMSMFGVLAVVGLLLGGCAGDEMRGSSGTGSAPGSGSAAAPTKGGIDRIASGAVEDTLNACLARIPKDASAGQKMLAEESCKRDQANRR
jgi:hypothetical protein